MELRHLRHFMAVAEHKQFRRAARAVGLSQQALSHSIAALEESLKAKLFERGKFGAELTHAGQLFERRARTICGEIDFAAAEMTAFNKGHEGEIRFGITPNFTSAVSPRAVLLFAKSYPRVRLAVTVATSKELFDQVGAGKLEVAITSPIDGTAASPELEHRELPSVYEHNLNFLIMNARHPLRRDGINLADLGGYHWCLPESLQTPWEKLFSLMCAAGAPAPKYILRTDSLAFAKELVARSDFISLLGLEAVLPELDSGVLVARELPLVTDPVRSYFSFRRGHTLLHTALALITCFKRALSGLEKAPLPRQGIGAPIARNAPEKVVSAVRRRAASRRPRRAA